MYKNKQNCKQVYQQVYATNPRTMSVNLLYARILWIWSRHVPCILDKTLFPFLAHFKGTF